MLATPSKAAGNFCVLRALASNSIRRTLFCYKIIQRGQTNKMNFECHAVCVLFSGMTIFSCSKVGLDYALFRHTIGTQTEPI